MGEIVHVAAAAIVNQRNEVLISQRAINSHQGGLWEFPGGKLETGESIEHALHRELEEELGIKPASYRPLIKITHHYPDKSVLLDVWKVNEFSGEPHGKEGQPVRWCAVSELDNIEFPDADVPVIRALNLPEHYLITGKFDSAEHFEKHFSNAVDKGIRLAQLRLTSDWVNANDIKLAREAIEIAQSLSSKNGVRLMFNMPDELSKIIKPDSIHLNSRKLAELDQRPACDFLSVSCHTIDEMKKAEELGVDFMVLSPVQYTNSHPDTVPLGWERFAEMISSINVPVYALGGVSREDTGKAWSAGGQGIAAIGALWNLG